MPRLAQALACRVVSLLQRYGPHRVRVAGKLFEVTDTVLNPKLFQTSELMAAHLGVRPGDDVLDIGTGSGIQAVVAADVARRVVAVDINPEAVACARENCRRNRADNVTVLEGDLFAPLAGAEFADARFDRIVFTPPYMEGEPRDAFARALYDPGKALVARFFEQADAFLKEGGAVRMLYSSIAEHERALAVATERGWTYEQVATRRTLIETYYIWELRPVPRFRADPTRSRSDPSALSCRG